MLGRPHALELLPHVKEILFTDFHFQYFFDDRLEVGQRAHGGERRGVCRPDHAANRGKYQSIFDLLQGNTASIELDSQQAIRPAQMAACSWRRAVSIEDQAHVFFSAGWRFVHGAVSSALRIAQRGPIDAQRVTVVANAAQQRFDHGGVAEEATPFVVAQVRS